MLVLPYALLVYGSIPLTGRGWVLCGGGGGSYWGGSFGQGSLTAEVAGGPVKAVLLFPDPPDQTPQNLASYECPDDYRTANRVCDNV